jgi:hypothetical protein
VFFRSGERTFFVYGFAKSDTANISGKELRIFKRGAKTDLKLTDKQIEARLRNGSLQEII